MTNTDTPAATEPAGPVLSPPIGGEEQKLAIASLLPTHNEARAAKPAKAKLAGGGDLGFDPSNELSAEVEALLADATAQAKREAEGAPRYPVETGKCSPIVEPPVPFSVAIAEPSSELTNSAKPVASFLGGEATDLSLRSIPRDLVAKAKVLARQRGLVLSTWAIQAFESAISHQNGLEIPITAQAVTQQELAEQEESEITRAGMEEIELLAADNTVPVAKISRLIAIQMVRVTEKLYLDNQNATKNRGDNYKAHAQGIKILHDIQRALVAAEPRMRRDSMDVTGKKFDAAFRCLCQGWEKAILSAGVPKETTTKVMTKFRSWVTAHQDDLKQAVTAVKPAEEQ